MSDLSLYQLRPKPKVVLCHLGNIPEGTEATDVTEELVSGFVELSTLTKPNRPTNWGLFCSLSATLRSR